MWGFKIRLNGLEWKGDSIFINNNGRDNSVFGLYQTLMSWTVLGFEKNKAYFEKLLATGELAHAYLFTGQEMIGKKTFALDLARLINNFSGEYLHDPDLFILDEKQGWGIERVRELKQWLNLRPYAGLRRIVIIDEAEKMGEEAASALLKVLEEPPSSALLLLVSAHPGKVLPTIASRTIVLKFAPLAHVEAVTFLEGIGLNKKQAEFLADFANGRLGLARRLQQSGAFKDIRSHLEQLNELLKANYFARLIFAEKFFGSKTEVNSQAILLNWMFYLRSDLSKGLKVNRARLLHKMLETHNILTKPQYNHRLAFENLLLSI